VVAGLMRYAAVTSSWRLGAAASGSDDRV